MNADGCIGVSPSNSRSRVALAAVGSLALLRAELVDAPAGGLALLPASASASSSSASSAERQLRVGDEAEVDREVLGDLVGVEVDVDDLARRGAKTPSSAGKTSGKT